MWEKLLENVLGCWHGHYSFPISVRPGNRRRGAASLTGTYVVCLDCGKEFPYDWNEMRVIGNRSDERHYLRSLATKEAA